MSTIAIPAIHCAKIISRFLSDHKDNEGLLLGGLKSELISETTDSIDHRISSKESYVLQGLIPTPLSTDSNLMEGDNGDFPSVSRVIGWYRCRYSYLTSMSLKERHIQRRLSEQYCDPLIFLQFIFVPTDREMKLYVTFNILNQREQTITMKVPTDIVNLMDTDQTYYFQANKGIVNFESEVIKSLIPPGDAYCSIKNTATESADTLFCNSISHLKSLHETAATRIQSIADLQKEIKELRLREKNNKMSSHNEENEKTSEDEFQQSPSF